MSGVLWPCLCAALACALLLLALAERSTASTVSVHETQAPVLPWLLGLALRASQALPVNVRGIPAPWFTTQTRAIARAGLAEILGPDRWAIMLACCALPGPLCFLFLRAFVELSPTWILPLAFVPPVLAQGWLRGQARRRSAHLVRELPAALDVLVLCLEAGAALTSALRITCEKAGPGPLRELLASVLRQIRAGQPRAAALRTVLGPLELEPVTSLMTALVQSELTGMSLGPVLRAQSTHAVTDRFLAAERAAMQAPVKLLVPLLFCIFPCTFIVIAVPIAARLAGVGGP